MSCKETEESRGCCGGNGSNGCCKDKPIGIDDAPRRQVILLVDDDPDFLNGLAKAIRKDGDCDVYVAQNAEVALAVLRSRPVTMLVTDHYMPGMTGVGLLELALEQFPSVVQILISGRATRTDLAGAINRANCSQFIDKWMSPDRMVKSILRQMPGRAA